MNTYKEGIGGRELNTYLIKIDGMYLVGFSDKEIGKAPSGGWYDTGGDIAEVILSPDKNNVKKIEGEINLKSYFNKIYDSMRYGNFEFYKLEIEKVVEQ